MKLFEILQVNYKSPIKPTSRKPNAGKFTDNNAVFSNIDNKLEKNPSSILGIGADAIVFQSKRAQNVGTVTKWVRNQRTDSNDNPYIKYLVKGHRLNSPYIPRVYNITQYERTNGIYEYAVQMEKLPFTFKQYMVEYWDDIDLVINVLNQIFTNKFSEYLLNEYPHSVNGVLAYIRKTLESGNVGRIELNPKIVPVLNLINDAAGDGDATRDMHTENIMIRLTSVGPQVVIIDPLLEN
jgi:hypothetical protein